MAKKQAERIDKYSWAVEGTRVLIKSYPLMKGEYGVITQRPTGDTAVVLAGEQRELIPLRHLEQVAAAALSRPDGTSGHSDAALEVTSSEHCGDFVESNPARLPPARHHQPAEDLNLPTLPSPPAALTREELSPDEERDLHRLELKVEKALSSAWLALKELRDRRLYRSTHHTFEEYAKDRFGYNRAHAYRLIAAGEVIENLSRQGGAALSRPPGTGGHSDAAETSPQRAMSLARDEETSSQRAMSPSGRQNETGSEMSPIWRQKLPTTESVCRELAKLPAEKQPVAWEKVLESSGDKIPNARCAKGIVEQLLEKPRVLASDYASEGEIFVLQRLEGKDRRYNGYWAVALEVEERFTVKCQVYNQTLDIRQENIKRVDMTSEQLEQQKKVIERVSRLARCNLDPVVWSMLETLNRQVYYTDVQLKFLEMAEKLYGISSGVGHGGSA